MGDVIKVWIWALGSFVLALWLTPIAFNGGKALSELSQTKDFNGVVNKAAAWSGAAVMEDFFKICWAISGAVLLLLLVEWLDLKKIRGTRRPWLVRMPRGAASPDQPGQAMKKNRWGALQGGAGFLASLGCFLLIGIAMVKAGSFAWEGNRMGWLDGFWIGIGFTLAIAICVEVFFRQIVLGIFLRAVNPVLAIALAAVMFASVPFILSGFAGTGGIDGEAISAFGLSGIVLLGGDLSARVVVIFLPWFAFGCVLGWARWRTASIWLPAGLLMGWLLADRLFSKVTEPVAIPDRMAAFLSSDSIHYGIIPLLGVIALGGFVHVATHAVFLKRSAVDESA